MSDILRTDIVTYILLLFVSIPLSMFMWAGNIAFTVLKPGSDDVISPIRWLLAVLIPLATIGWGIRKKSISKSGAILGFFMAFILTLASYCFVTCLFVFFVTSSKATKFRAHAKRRLTVDFKEGSKRTWIQVLCNGGMATQLALLYLLDSGVGERPIDFSSDYRASWLSLGIVGTFACANADTWASELGSVLSSSDPWLITTGKRVPKGVNGGVSLMGLFVSLGGGLIIGCFFYLLTMYTIDSKVLLESPPQWPIIPISGLAGFIGSLLDSFLGATLQFSGVDKKTGLIVEHGGTQVLYICGRRILDNHSVNFLTTIIIGICTPKLAYVIWPY